MCHLMARKLRQKATRIDKHIATSIYAILRRPSYHTQEGSSLCFIPPFAYTMNGLGEEEVVRAISISVISVIFKGYAYSQFSLIYYITI